MTFCIRFKRRSTADLRLTGEIADGDSVCHTCDNPPCVNPSHLFVGSHSDNMRDMVSKGRNVPPVCPSERRARGERNTAAKLTASQVREIRSRYIPQQVSQQALADEYGVGQAIISAILRRKVWPHVE